MTFIVASSSWYPLFWFEKRNRNFDVVFLHKYCRMADFDWRAVCVESSMKITQKSTVLPHFILCWRESCGQHTKMKWVREKNSLKTHHRICAC